MSGFLAKEGMRLSGPTSEQTGTPLSMLGNGMRRLVVVCFLFHVKHVRLGKIMPRHIIAPLSPNRTRLLSAFEF
ncbi:MAG: hypothetical protein CMN90_06845 [Sutterellaceae bacterium]|nr:hypothetical protein [Sutterellaceae bacterium]